MSLLRAEKRAQLRAEKATDKQQIHDPSDTGPMDPARISPSSQASNRKTERIRAWGQRLRTPKGMTWCYNLALLAYLGIAWGGSFVKDLKQEKLAQEVAYRVSRFTGEIGYLERTKNIPADFMLGVGEAPYLMRGELHLLWKHPPSKDVAFLWQNDHFARQRGVVVVSRNRELLQRVDALLDDGDLGNGTAQMHPRGLWVSLH